MATIRLHAGVSWQVTGTLCKGLFLFSSVIRGCAPEARRTETAGSASQSTAQCNGVSPARLECEGFAPAPIKALMTPAEKLLEAAQCSGVVPAWFSADASPEFSRRILTVVSDAPLLAQCRGVLPHASRSEGFRPAASSARTPEELPRKDASMRGSGGGLEVIITPM